MERSSLPDRLPCLIVIRRLGPRRHQAHRSIVPIPSAAAAAPAAPAAAPAAAPVARPAPYSCTIGSGESRPPRPGLSGHGLPALRSIESKLAGRYRLSSPRSSSSSELRPSGLANATEDMGRPATSPAGGLFPKVWREYDSVSSESPARGGTRGRAPTAAQRASNLRWVPTHSKQVAQKRTLTGRARAPSCEVWLCDSDSVCVAFIQGQE